MQTAWKTDFVMQKARSNNNKNNYKKSSDTYNRFFDVFGVTSISNIHIKSWTTKKVNKNPLKLCELWVGGDKFRQLTRHLPRHWNAMENMP